MFVKIETETVWDGQRIGAGSVIDVPAETYELNKSWMKAVDAEAEKLAKPKPAEKVPGES